MTIRSMSNTPEYRDGWDRIFGKKEDMSLLVAPLIASVLVCVHPRRAQVHKRLVMVVDCSGSMSPHFADAMQAVMEIAGQPTDDMEIAIYAFGTYWARWPTKGYQKLPDAKALAAADVWLRTAEVGGDTFVQAPLSTALREPGPRTVVLVSDGKFHNVSDETLRKIVGKDPLLCFGVGNPKYQDTLDMLGKTGGGFYRIVERKQ